MFVTGLMALSKTDTQDEGSMWPQHGIRTENLATSMIFFPSFVRSFPVFFFVFLHMCHKECVRMLLYASCVHFWCTLSWGIFVFGQISFT